MEVGGDGPGIAARVRGWLGLSSAVSDLSWRAAGLVLGVPSPGSDGRAIVQRP